MNEREALISYHKREQRDSIRHQVDAASSRVSGDKKKMATSIKEAGIGREVRLSPLTRLEAAST